MSETTNIFDLPTDPVTGGANNNIVITAQEMRQQPGQGQSATQVQGQGQGMSLDQSTINQIISGLQQATIAGATQLPSRDIPMNTNNITADPQVVPNYVPTPPQNREDYIKNEEQIVDLVNKYNKNTQVLDDMYNEVQTPLLIAILFFLFQLPFFRKFLYKYLPVLFSIDGNYNLNGFLFTSVLFGIVFHCLCKVTTYFSTF